MDIFEGLGNELGSRQAVEGDGHRLPHLPHLVPRDAGGRVGSQFGHPAVQLGCELVVGDLFEIGRRVEAVGQAVDQLPSLGRG